MSKQAHVHRMMSYLFFQATSVLWSPRTPWGSPSCLCPTASLYKQRPSLTDGHSRSRMPSPRLWWEESPRRFPVSFPVALSDSQGLGRHKALLLLHLGLQAPGVYDLDPKVMEQMPLTFQAHEVRNQKSEPMQSGNPRSGCSGSMSVCRDLWMPRPP